MAFLLDQLEETARRFAKRPAYYLGKKQISIGEVNTLGNRIAHWLRARLPAGPSVVAVFGEADILTAAAIFGILKAEKAFLGLDPSYQEDSLRAMVTRSGCSLVIAVRETPQPTLGPVDIVTLSDVVAQSSPYPSTAPTRGSNGGVPAYVTFTSGSTGTPKPIVAPVLQVDNRFRWMWDQYPFSEAEVCCHRMPLGFVDSIWELLGPVCVGTPVALLAARRYPVGQDLVNAIASYGVSRLWVLPVALNDIIETISDFAQRLPSLRFWVCTGDALSPALAAKFYRSFSNATLYNLYGTSEVWDATWYEVPREGLTGLLVPIGKPISNVEVVIVDKDGRSAPDGTSGEIVVAGSGLALGYFDQKIGEVQPFLRRASGTDRTMFFTGDVGIRTETGDLLFRGRSASADQATPFVSIVELEAALLLDPRIREGAVTISRPDNGKSVVTAYFRARSTNPVGTGDIMTFLKNRWPTDIRPDRVVRLDAFPLTASGKIARRELAAWEREHST